MNCIHCLYDIRTILGADYVSNLISLVSLLLGFLAFFYGLQQVDKYIEYKKEAQAEAPFGYHIHLSVFIKRFMCIIGMNLHPNWAVWYLLSDNFKKNVDIQALNVDSLQDEFAKFIDYLSHTSRQVPPLSCTGADERKWSNNMNILTSYLIEFSFIGKYSSSKYSTDSEIMGEYQKLIEALNWILEKMEEPASSNPTE